MAITDPPGGGNLRRGIAAYKRTLGQPQGADTSGVPGGRAAPPQAASGSKAGLGDGLIKAGALDGILNKGFVRQGKKTPPGEKESKYRRVAKFLILIGEDEAARILSGLAAEQVEEIAREIAAVRGITSDEAETIFKEFRNLLGRFSGYTGGAAGGIEEARRILYAAFGPVQGETFLRRTVPEAAGNPLDFLDDFSGEQVTFLLREESPAAAALVLSRLSPKVSAAVLANTPPDRKLEIVRRIAHLGQVSPEVLDRVAGALREKARHIAEAGSGSGLPEVDGMNALTAILKHADNSFGERLLSELEENDPDIGRDLKDRLYTLEDILEADNRPIQEKLKVMEDRDIALLLKGRSAGFIDKMLSNVSANRRILIREESEILGPVPKIEVEAVARDFLSWFRLGREEGRILMNTDKDVIV